MKGRYQAANTVICALMCEISFGRKNYSPKVATIPLPCRHSVSSHSVFRISHVASYVARETTGTTPVLSGTTLPSTAYTNTFHVVI